MTDNKKDKTETLTRDDLERDPGIGQSKGSFMTGVPPEEIEGENTLEGDVENDSTASDGAPQRDKARTNA
ncbi:MAG TPA: hypothetical protein VF757_03125 [Sphingomicrobium sp.]